jgi:predicted nucleotidyltransferase component of viral defense system
MNLQYKTVSKPLLDCLRKLMSDSAFNDFVLVGGTALSLQCGHRVSFDIDLFTSIEYGSMNLEMIKSALEKSFPFIDSLEKLNFRNLGYMVYIGNTLSDKIKLDLFYTENFIAPILQQDGLRLASLQDIAAMKMQAIVNSKRKKDFWDIHELLDHFTLEEMIQFGLQRNPYSLSEIDIINSLTNPFELSQDSSIKCLRGKYWELIVDDLQTAAELYKNRFLKQ